MLLAAREASWGVQDRDSSDDADRDRWGWRKLPAAKADLSKDRGGGQRTESSGVDRRHLFVQLVLVHDGDARQQREAEKGEGIGFRVSRLTLVDIASGSHPGGGATTGALGATAGGGVRAKSATTGGASSSGAAAVTMDPLHGKRRAAGR